MITRKAASDNSSYVDQASEALRQLIASGATNACEAVFERYPQLYADLDGLLEIIYLESVLRQDREPDLTISELTSEYIQRFPAYQHDIVKLLEVNQAFSSLGIRAPGTTGVQRSEAFSAAWEPSIGTIGDYQLLEVLGQGGMGVVYRAIQTRLGRVVALKTIAADHVDGATTNRFQKEAELASSLQHPNIVQIHEVGMHNELPFYSMEYVTGGSLAEFLKDHPLRPERAAKLVSVLARAMDFAHSRGIVHRDLKPANILLSPSTRPEALKIHDSRSNFEGKTADESAQRFEAKIVDFGLAIQLGTLGTSMPVKRAAGTPSYMAPEQIDTSIGPSTAVTDVYALGSILYHALVGRPPFYSASTQETLRQVREDEPLPPRKLQPKISGDLETICLKCLRKAPAVRYANAAELADDLQRYLDGKPIQARPASYPELAYKWAVRHPSLVGLLVAMLLAFIAITSLWRQSASSLAAELAERIKSEQLRYDRSIALAHFEYQSHNVDRALEILGQCDPQYRNFEWNLVKNLCNEPTWECKSRNSERLTCASLSSDGNLAATGHGSWGEDREHPIYVWDIPNNQLLWNLQGHPPCEICAVDFHPSGKRLLGGGMVWKNREVAGGVREWDLKTGKLIRVVADKNVRSACYSQGGSRIFVGESGGEVGIYDSQSAELLFRCRRHRQLVLAMCESSDGRLLATSSRDGTLAVWEIATGREIAWIKDMEDPRDIHWTKDMSRLIVACYGGRVDTFRWRANRLELESTTSQTDSQIAQISPDGETIVTGVVGDSIKLQRVDDGHVISVLHGHRAQVRAIDFDQSGRWLLTAGADGSCRLWDLIRPYGYVHKSFLPVADTKSIAGRPGAASFALALGLQGSKTRETSGGGSIQVFDPIKQAVVHTYRLKNSIAGEGDFPTLIGYSPSGDWLCSGSIDKRIYLWKTDQSEPHCSLPGHLSALMYVGMPSDDRVISVDTDGLLKVWDITKQCEVSQWQLTTAMPSDDHQNVRAVTLDLNQQWVAVGTDSQLNLLHLQTHQLLKSVKLDLAVNKIAFCPNSQRLAVATASPKTLVFTIKKSSQGIELSSPLELIGNRDRVTALAFSPDSRRLASLGHDEALRLYELELGNELLKLEGGSLTNGVVAFSSDGQQLMRVTANHAYTYSLRRIDPRYDLNEGEALASWHRSRFLQAFSSLRSYGAAFHCRRLIELEPGNPWHQINLARIMITAGQLVDAQRCLEALESSDTEVQCQQLYCMIRIALLTRNEEACRMYLQELECLTLELDTLNSWNDLVWYGSLVPGAPIRLPDAIRRLEYLVGNTRQGNYFNTLALGYYRIGSYATSYAASEASMLTSDRPSPPPIDSLIQSLCQISHLQRSQPSAKADSNETVTAAEASQRQLFQVRSTPLHVLLRDVETCIRESDQRRSFPKKLSRAEADLFHLEIPWLLRELEQGMTRCDLTDPIFARVRSISASRSNVQSPASPQ